MLKDFRLSDNTLYQQKTENKMQRKSSMERKR